MRKIIRWGLLGTGISVAVICLVARLAKPAPEVRGGLELREEDAMCAPDEPHPVDALLADPAKLTADAQLLEPIDLLKSKEAASQPEQDDARKQSRGGLAPENPFPEAVVPAAAIRSADEAACFRLMPYSETTELLPFLPHADDAGEAGLGRGNTAGTLKHDHKLLRFSQRKEELNATSVTGPPPDEAGSESQEQEEESTDSRAIQERLNRVLRSYLQEKYAMPAGVDTMEFRPSDAKRGEFDRMPF
jgi:hypothetical protein